MWLPFTVGNQANFAWIWICLILSLLVDWELSHNRTTSIVRCSFVFFFEGPFIFLEWRKYTTALRALLRASGSRKITLICYWQENKNGAERERPVFFFKRGERTAKEETLLSRRSSEKTVIRKWKILGSLAKGWAVLEAILSPCLWNDTKHTTAHTWKSRTMRRLLFTRTHLCVDDSKKSNLLTELVRCEPLGRSWVLLHWCLTRDPSWDALL